MVLLCQHVHFPHLFNSTASLVTKLKVPFVCHIAHDCEGKVSLEQWFSTCGWWTLGGRFTGVTQNPNYQKTWIFTLWFTTAANYEVATKKIMLWLGSPQREELYSKFPVVGGLRITILKTTSNFLSLVVTKKLTFVKGKNTSRYQITAAYIIYMLH